MIGMIVNILSKVLGMVGMLRNLSDLFKEVCSFLDPLTGAFYSTASLLSLRSSFSYFFARIVDLVY